jgi:hypothetical protein
MRIRDGKNSDTDPQHCDQQQKYGKIGWNQCWARKPEEHCVEPVTYGYGTLLAKDPGRLTEEIWQDWDLCRILLGEYPTMSPLLLLLPPILRVRLELGEIFLILDTS